MPISQITFLISVWLFIPFIDYAELKASNDKTKDLLPKEIRINKLLMLRLDPAEFSIGMANLQGKGEPFEGIRDVKISNPFYLGKTEVTQELWNSYMKENHSRFIGNSLPAEGMTWEEAMEFCRRLNLDRSKFSIPQGMIFRLPSEAEWEFAAGTGSNDPFFFGSKISLLTKYAWISSNVIETTKPVGKLSPNKWGFHDIYGNVREWCLDGYGPRPPRKLIDPLLHWTNMDKVTRGGSWVSCEVCCKTAKRMNYGENYQASDIGFRLALGFVFPEMRK
ncbi:MAG: SUMF1/EgtB/PvdO family nonheme iron enzyme [Verrucomicrobiota bacterium]|nr:SUMF1/EgtB/PvdO family nonheme iron enzyme [Verrucomicrobiota bacterium]